MNILLKILKILLTPVLIAIFIALLLLVGYGFGIVLIHFNINILPLYGDASFMDTVATGWIASVVIIVFIMWSKTSYELLSKLFGK